MYKYTYRGNNIAIPLYFIYCFTTAISSGSIKPWLLTKPFVTAYSIQPYSSEVIIIYQINAGSHHPRLSKIDF